MHQVKLATSVLFLVLAFHTFEVQGAFFPNGLTRNGKNVCVTTKSRTVVYYITAATVGYEQYKAKCGVFGWGRCTKSRAVTRYKSKPRFTRDYDTHLSCCSGYRKSGNECPKAICRYGCNNGGTCVSPDTCNCTAGWTGSTCSLDIDECSPNNGGCEQTCINRPGKERVCTCRRGYITNGTKCVDVNECRLKQSACICAITKSNSNVCGTRCRNTDGGFTCSCGKGYSLHRGTVCRDNNECAVNYGGCSQKCVNFIGGYNCTCQRGFRLVNDKICEDVNECEYNNGYCEHTCQNAYGSHWCECYEGFKLDSNRKTCSDIDECKLGHQVHGCEDYCNNTRGGYFCSCRKGYELTKNNRACTDIDECASNNIAGSNETATRSACHHICTNVEGSFLCSCKNGYTLMYDKKQCKDTDECQTGKHSCEHNCHNTDGSYLCSCKTGYELSLNGRSCEAQPCVEIDPPWQGRMTCSGNSTDAKCTFSCNPGYDLLGSQSRTCLPSSSWSGNRTSCKPKHCKTLTTTLPSQTLMVPCFTFLGSTCYFGCRRGFVLRGDGQAHCGLNSKGDSVSWNIGRFSCEEIKTCQPNPCRHEGKCMTLDENSFICNCENTGYKGSRCETGFINTPIFPKLRLNISSKALTVLARPSKRLRVSLSAEDGVTIHPSSVEIQFPKRKEAFTVEGAKPGIKAITYILEGENRHDFETPERSVLFIKPDITNHNTKLFLMKGELPIGCEKYKTNKIFSCDLHLISTSPWMGTPPSTNGVVHFVAVNNQTIPLSLTGLNLSKLHLSRDEMIETGIAATSSFKQFPLLHQKNGKCYSQVADSNNQLELIDNDAFVSSFMQAVSAMAPEWLTVTVTETNQYFDIQNIAVSLASGLKHCLGFPINAAHSLIYYRPAVNYKMRVEQNEIPLSADGRTCFAINICKPGLFINFPKSQAQLLKSNLNVFRDMKDSCGLDLNIDSIGFLNKETTHFVKGMIWNGVNLQKLSPLSYSAWLKGRVDWRIEIPKLLFVTFKMNGETIIKSRNIDTIFTDRMSQRMEMQFKGKAFVNITGRALKKDFVLELESSKINGKAILGGRNTCNKNVQGIFITLEKSAYNLLDRSPFSTYILPIETEPIRLAILVSLNGGMQNKLLNIREIKRSIKDLTSFTPKVQKFIRKANSILPKVKVVTESPLEMTEQLNELTQEMDKALDDKRMNVMRTLALAKQINSRIEYLKKFVEFITPMAFSSNDFSLLRMIFQIQPANFPKPFHVNLGGEHVQASLQGISLHLRTSLCMGQLCFNDLTTTIDYLAERNCFPKVPYLSVLRAKANFLTTMSLSEGNILTLPKGEAINMVFPRESDTVTAHFAGEIQLFGAKKRVNVAWDKKQLSFQIQEKIFSKYMADMKVTAETNYALKWKSLSFTVEGRMMNSSLLSTSLQEKVITFARYLAQKATKRVQNCKKSLLLSEQRVDSAERLVREKTRSLNKAEKEKKEKDWKLQNIYYKYKNSKSQPQLTRFLMFNSNETCDIQNCSYIVSNISIPEVCHEEVIVNYTVPTCSKQERNLEVEELIQVKKQLKETITTGVVSETKCGKFKSQVLNSFGCHKHQRKITTDIWHDVIETHIRTKIVKFAEFKCEYKIESLVSGYARPTICSKSDVGGRAKIVDPSCVSQNLQCLSKMSSLKKKINKLNQIFFDVFRNMSKEGEQATIAQLEANKARIYLDVATKQLELAQAQLKQYKFAKESINLTKVTLREKLGLNVGEKIRNLGGKELVSIENLTFSVSMTRSSTKSRLPLTANVRTFEGSHKAIQFSIDFRREKDSLASASKFIVESLFGTSRLRSRRRRSTREDFLRPKINGGEFPLEQHDCLFSYQAHVFFSDIVASLDFAIKNKKELEKAMSAGIRDLEKLTGIEDNSDEFLSGPQQQIRASFSDIIQSLKVVQINSSGAISWNNTLDDVRGFLNVLSWAKNFTECSGIQDCTDFFFDSLEEMYEMEYHPRAIEIKTMLKSLERIINSMLKENHDVSTLEGMILQAKVLIANSSDDIILCGTKPEIERNSPVQLVVILGETVNLTCQAKSTLEVEYLWIKNDEPLEESNSTSLELQNVTKQSEGVYKCQASNKRGKTISNVTIVEVHQRPIITKQPPDGKGLVGDEEYLMDCNSSGVPRPLTEWFFIPMKAEKQETVRINTAGRFLRLANLTTAEAGFYFCNVSNLHGEVQSRMARLDVSSFLSGVPRIAVSLKLKQCVSTESPGNNKTHCKERRSRKAQRVDSSVFEYITREMLERLRWPVERVKTKHYNPFPDASISLVVHGDVSSIHEGKKLEVLNSFSMSRQRMGNSFKELYFSLEDRSITFKWKNLSISIEKESLAVEILPQWCPIGTSRHENGFLCVYCLPGYYGVANGSCMQCPIGTYQPDEGSTECVKCPFQISYTEPGAVQESQCVDISIPCKSPEITTKYALAPKEMKELYHNGETIVLGCIPGYRVVGNGTRECNEGNWTENDFYCERTCLPPWTELKKRCYLVIETQTHGWEGLYAKCQNLTSHMVTISSEEENQFTGQLAKIYLEERKMGQRPMWLGLMKTHEQFRWVDGSPLEGYTNWNSGEPNNLNGREMCTEMLVSTKVWLNKWNDLNCDSDYKSITVCEKPLRKHD